MLRTLTIALALSLAACSSGKPSEREIRDALQNAKYEEEYFAVKNVELIDGLQRSEGTYEADVTYELHFKVGIDEISDQMKAQSANDPMASFGAGIGLMALRVQFGSFKKGDMTTLEERLQLVKSEKGWRIDDGAPARRRSASAFDD